MPLESAFRVSVFFLAVVANTMLAFAEGAASPHALTIPLALLALYGTESRRMFCLPTWGANLLGVLALVAAGWEYLEGHIEARLLSGAHLLVYTSWIVFFLSKTPRHYWWLCALATLQVAVGSVLTYESWYGAVLVVYVAFAIWTLALFSLYRACARLSASSPATHRNETALSGSGAKRGFADEAHRTTAGAYPWLGGGTVQGAVQKDAGERWISLRLAAGTSGTAAAAILVGAILFVFVPRVEIGHRQVLGAFSEGAGVRALTGFSDRVELGAIGEILESTEPVFQVRVVDERDREMDVNEFARRLGYDEPLFRGTTLRTYVDGRWQRDDFEMYMGSFRRRTRGVRQEYRLEPLGTPILFAIQPAASCRVVSEGSTANINWETSTLLRRATGAALRRACEYTVSTPLPDKPPERPFTIAYVHPPVYRRAGRYRNPYLRLPDGLDRLAELSRQVVEEPAPATSELEKAERLERYLRDSGRFRYSLNMAIEDPSVDPVEDFLFNRRAGHCEYFASALALMLRSVGIPSRLVNGFKGGRVNGLTGLFEVEQRHAHTWVEAFINGRWLVFDPTPAARADSVASMEKGPRSWNDFKRLLNDFWSNYVIHMSLDRQQVEIYQPLRRKGSRLVADAKAVARRLGRWFLGLARSPDRWFSWQGLVATLLVGFTAVAIGWAIRSAVGLVRRMRLFGRRAGRLAAPVEFYERFKRLMERCGLVREASQTHTEFAASVTRQLRPLLEASALVEAPGRIVSAYHLVRFGGRSLDDEQVDALRNCLSRLERCLQGNGRSSRREPSRGDADHATGSDSPTTVSQGTSP